MELLKNRLEKIKEKVSELKQLKTSEKEGEIIKALRHE